MITRVLVKSKMAMAEIWKQIPEDQRNEMAIISIVDLDDEHPSFDDCKYLLEQKFSDSEPGLDVKFPQFGTKSMTFEQAKEVITFIDTLHKRDGPILLFVHCAAGICRSGAVGTYAKYVAGERIGDIIFKQDNPHILPNTWVLNLLYHVGG